MRNALVLVFPHGSTENAEGCARLHEPFDFDSDLSEWYVLELGSSFVPFSQDYKPGFYAIRSIMICEAKREGIICHDGSGDDTGFTFPALDLGPMESLAEAIDKIRTMEGCPIMANYQHRFIFMEEAQAGEAQNWLRSFFAYDLCEEYIDEDTDGTTTYEFRFCTEAEISDDDLTYIIRKLAPASSSVNALFS